MPVIPELDEVPFVRDDDEGLFSRDFNGQLVRLEAATEADYGKTVKLQIDGQEIEVPLAEPLTDANGNVVVDLEGRTTPRYTTIYDAATKLYVKQEGDEGKIPIPILCHQPHMAPVAVCRLCVVQIYGQKRGRRAAERKLLPACQHQVKNGMEVFTMNDKGADGDRVRQTVKVMTELLASDHLKPVQQDLSPELNNFNELAIMANRTGAKKDRFKLDVLSTPAPAPAPNRGRRGFDSSSPVFLVDHTACILCERCVRACDDVQENHVIGRTGKGATAGVSFDLNDLMGESSCVKCGECMVSCPTSAITFKPVAQINIKKSVTKGAEVLNASDLSDDLLFSGIPPKFLYWQQGLVLRRRLKKGQVLCRQGDAGNTAFIIKSGKLEVQVYPKKKAEGGLLAGLLGGIRTPVLRFQLTPANVIVGEMACLSGTPRAADVVALEDGEVWEVRRNVLDRLMRLPTQRARFEREYRERAMDLVLQETELFKGVDDAEYRAILDFLRARLTFVRVKTGQVLFRQGDRVSDLYFVRLGHVRIAIERMGNEVKVVSAGPGSVLGEIGLLGLTTADSGRSVDQVETALLSVLNRHANDLEGFPQGARTATCSALGHLELARLSRTDFLAMIAQFPQLRRRFVEQSMARLRSNDQSQPILREFVEQGLFEGTNILVLNLDKCTRCDECTRGCIEQHGTESHGLHIPRLLRDGLRFENYLVATSCRSCMDPHCMFGCPVDSIHRGRHLQIVIEDHCIGCGLCAENCPYGNIAMVPNQHRRIEVYDEDLPGKKLSVAQPKASTCDLCDAEGKKAVPEPRCVSSCPHEAAERMTGDALLQKVMVKSGRRR